MYPCLLRRCFQFRFIVHYSLESHNNFSQHKNILTISEFEWVVFKKLNKSSLKKYLMVSFIKQKIYCTSCRLYKNAA